MLHIVNPLYSHVHFSKKHHSLESLSHLLLAQNICKAFFVNVIIMGKSKINIRVLQIVVPFGNVSVALYSNCAN
jgi:hypothetical protein